MHDQRPCIARGLGSLTDELRCVVVSPNQLKAGTSRQASSSCESETRIRSLEKHEKQRVKLRARDAHRDLRFDKDQARALDDNTSPLESKS